MLNLHLQIRNPWATKFKILWNRAYDTPFKYKFIELEFTRDTSIVLFTFNWNIRQSHAGLDIELGLFGFCIHFTFYDVRHWNSQAGRYYTYSEELGEH